MGKKRIEIIITSALILMLVFAWLNAFKVLDKKVKKGAKPQPAVYSPKMESALMQSGEKAVEADKYSKWQEGENIDFVRSPFSGKRYGEEEPINFKVSGLMWDDENPQVIINNRISKVGDSIDGFILEKIEKQKVTLFNGKKRIELNI